MPHAALWVVQPYGIENVSVRRECFNAARGFVGGAAVEEVNTNLPIWKFQCRTRLCGWCSETVLRKLDDAVKFQCRTRLCGWCSFSHSFIYIDLIGCFNAARGFVGGAA